MRSASIFHSSPLLVVIAVSIRYTGEDHAFPGVIHQDGQHNQLDLHYRATGSASEQRDLVSCRCGDRFRWSKVQSETLSDYTFVKYTIS